MDKDIIELIPKDKNDIQSTLENKIVLDVVESGQITDEFMDLISQDIGLKSKNKTTTDSSILDKVKDFFAFDWVDNHNRVHNDKNNRFERKTLEFLGEEFVGYKGQDAVDKLMLEKRGYVRDAFNRKDIGGIALIWGDEERGLAHIIKRRKDSHQPLGKLLHSLNEVIENGVLEREPNGDFNIKYKGKKVVIEPKLFNDKLQFVMTAYYDGK